MNNQNTIRQVKLKGMPKISYEINEKMENFYKQPDNSELYLKILQDYLEENLNINFRLYRENYFKRRLFHRISRLNNIHSIRQYVQYLKDSKGELDTFRNNLTIHVTEFFRDIEPFRLVENEILKTIARTKKDTEEPIRILSAPCSTGEEVYSFSIIAQHLKNKMRILNPVEIFGCDIERDVIDVAMTGIYPQNTLKNIKRSSVQKNFIRLDERTYKIKQHLKENVTFFVHDLFKPLNISNFDIISCRNFLIYISKKNQKVVIDNLSRLLNPNGFFILGKTEGFSILNNSEYKPYNLREHIYRKIA